MPRISVAFAAALMLMAASFTSATSTEPLDIRGEELPKRFLMRDIQTGALSFSFKENVAGKAAVASYRFGGFDFQSITGWFYLQITSRKGTLAAAEKSLEARRVGGLHAKGQASPINVAALSDLGALSTSATGTTYAVEGSDNFFYAGYIEGTIGAQDGRMNFPQYSSGKTTYPACQTKWLADHFAWLNANYLKAQNKQHPADVADYWDQMVRLWNQLDGMAAGYNKYSGTNFTATDAYLANLASDAMDMYCQQTANNGEYVPSLNHITTRKDKTSVHNVKKAYNKKHADALGHEPLSGGPLHCSAIVKLTDDDFFSSHQTWSGYDAGFGVRTWKTYALGPIEKIRTVVFSGRIDGSISSVDDFYTNYDAKASTSPIVVWETTMEIYNLALYKASVPQLCGEFSRVMAANFIANTPKQWSEKFATLNGGEYCNSYVALAIGAFEAGKPLPDGTFYVAEQAPNYVEYSDMTWFVRENKYFPSFNIPYYPYIYNITGNLQVFEQLGNFNSWTKYSRAEIFARNQSDVKDTESFMRLVRYNNWQKDPLSAIAPQFKTGCAGATNGVCTPANSAMLATSSRGDLMKVYPTNAENIAHYGSADPGMMAQACFGATDAKFTSFKATKDGKRTSYINNGPTNDQQPVFDWSGSCNNNVPKRTPSILDYPWVKITSADDE